MTEIDLSTVVDTPMSEEEARIVTDEIREQADRLWGMLLNVFRRKGWKALGYKSWSGYFEAEFGRSRSRSYQLLDAGRVLEALEPAGFRGEASPGSPLLNEAAARELRPLLRNGAEAIREAYDEAVEEAGGQPTATQVRKVVERKRRDTLHAVPDTAPEPVREQHQSPEWMARVDALVSELQWLLAGGGRGDPAEDARAARSVLELVDDVVADLRQLASGG